MTKLTKNTNFFFAFLLSIYLFILLGFILHTSAHPVIFGKYTQKYFISLVLLCIAPPVVFFMLKKLTAKFSKRAVFMSFVLITIVVFSIIEISLRTKYRQYESTNYRATIDNYDPFLQAKLASSDNLQINSLGFRGEEIKVKKSDDTFRIVILGGSTVLNREVPFKKNAARLLEKKLRTQYPDKKIEVLNAGKDGYTSEHSLIQYMFKIRDLRPDLIIMWHGINDMWASCTLEGLTHGPYKPDYSHLYGATANIMFNYFRPQPLIQLESVTADFIIKGLKDNFYSDITNTLRVTNTQKRAEAYKAGINTIKVHDFPSINAYERNLLYLIDLAKRDSTALILGNQANLLKEKPTVQETEKIMSPSLICLKDGKYYNLESLHFGITEFNKTTKSIAEKNDIFFIDFDSQLPKNFSYFLDSVHYTEKGNEAISNILFKKILDEKIIE